jgi:hypothetical protein
MGQAGRKTRLNASWLIKSIKALDRQMLLQTCQLLSSQHPTVQPHAHADTCQFPVTSGWYEAHPHPPIPTLVDFTRTALCAVMKRASKERVCVCVCVCAFQTSFYKETAAKASFGVAALPC